jgi:hypothetical protein
MSGLRSEQVCVLWSAVFVGFHHRHTLALSSRLRAFAKERTWPWAWVTLTWCRSWKAIVTSGSRMFSSTSRGIFPRKPSPAGSLVSSRNFRLQLQHTWGLLHGCHLIDCAGQHFPESPLLDVHAKATAHVVWVPTEHSNIEVDYLQIVGWPSNTVVTTERMQSFMIICMKFLTSSDFHWYPSHSSCTTFARSPSRPALPEINPFYIL